MESGNNFGVQRELSCSYCEVVAVRVDIVVALSRLFSYLKRFPTPSPVGTPICPPDRPTDSFSIRFVMHALTESANMCIIIFVVDVASRCVVVFLIHCYKYK